MRRANRYAIRTAPRPVVIPEAEVFARVLTAIKTLKAMPDREWKFLNPTLRSSMLTPALFFEDMTGRGTYEPLSVERKIVETKPVVPVMRHEAEPGGVPRPMLLRDGVREKVRHRNAVYAAGASTFSLKESLHPVSIEQPKNDEETPQERWRPKRAEISDAIVAGEWFALLAIIPRNVSEHERQLRLYQAGIHRSRLIVDQLILDLWASGWPVDYIAAHSRVRMSEKEVLARFKIIASDLYEIANGTAELANVDARKRAERDRQARASANGTAAKAG